MKQKWIKNPPATGNDDGLNQDYNRELSKWFSSRLTAKDGVRRAFPSQFNNSRNQNENIHRLAVPTD